MKQSNLSTFAGRLGYLRWLKHMADGEPPTNEAIGEAVDRSGAWVGKWLEREDAPRDYVVHRPLAAYFGASEGWIIRNEGDPPDAPLWRRWLAARGIPDRTHVDQEPTESELTPAERDQPQRKAAGAIPISTAGGPGKSRASSAAAKRGRRPR